MLTVNFSGRLGRDAEVKRLQNNLVAINFSVCTEVTENGQKRSEWLTCTLFRQEGKERISQYLTKGTQVQVSGLLIPRSWENKEGEKCHSLNVNVDHVTLLGSKKQEEPQATEIRTQSEYTRPESNKYERTDLPF